MLPQIRLAETSSEQPSPLRVLSRLAHGKDAQSRKVGQLLVPDVLGEFGRDGVDLLEAFRVGNGDFGR